MVDRVGLIAPSREAVLLHLEPPRFGRNARLGASAIWRFGTRHRDQLQLQRDQLLLQRDFLLRDLRDLL